MSVDDYSEGIDWDKIYSAFHSPKSIANRIQNELDYPDAHMIFCGFPEVASHLSAHSQILFVDRSPVIVARSRTRYPDIDEVSNKEIFEILKGNSTKQIVISCRLSAFWQSSQAFEQLANAILAHPRNQILIDFFDRNSVRTGQHIHFESQAGKGRWHIKTIEDHPSDNPPIHLVRMEIEYAVGTLNFSYDTRRAFFAKTAVEAWCNDIFAEYSVSHSGPLLQNDPSFLIKMTHVG